MAYINRQGEALDKICKALKIDDPDVTSVTIDVNAEGPVRAIVAYLVNAEKVAALADVIADCSVVVEG